MTTARKTVEIEKLINYANGFLAAKGGTADSRYGVICVLEQALFAANRYYGYRYLGEDETGQYDKPGIRWENYQPGNRAEDGRFDDTDSTRRCYA